MNPAELYKRVADVLGVSASQKYLAFEVLTEFIAEILTDGITLKVPRIGFFQLKNDAVKRNSVKQLMFSSLPEDFDRTEKVLYHTFDVNPKYKNPFEMDSQVFSIGVGKPLLPLQDEESAHDSETSFAMLRKSIEERVKEIIAESDQIPNFNIWEDIYSNDDVEFDLAADNFSKLLDPTSDINFTENIKPVVPEVDKQQQDFLNSLLNNDKPEASEEFFAEEKNHVGSENGNTSEQQFLEDDLYKIDEAESSLNLSVADLLGETDWMKNADLPQLPNEEVNKEIEESELTQNLSVDDLLGEMGWTQKTDLPLTKNEIENKETEELESTQNLSISNLLDGFEWIQNIDSSLVEDETAKNKMEEPEQTLLEEQIDITIPESFEDQAKIDVPESPTDLVNYSGATFGVEIEPEPVQGPVENLSATDSVDNEVLKNLLSDDEPEEVEKENDEITIEPPSSGKELLIIRNEEAEENKNNWAIEEDDLKGIINEELREYDHEKIANDNSRVLNDLLEDAFHRKVETDSNSETDEEISADEVPEEQVITGKIEWSWGDELKEEFGIRSEDDEETEIIPENPLSLIFEEEDFVEPTEFEFDIDKTRQDLFSRLEKTLEREVTSLHDNFPSSVEEEPKIQKLTSEKIVHTKPEIKTELPNTKVSNEVPPVAEFKDEKVFLDFKTPPPRYEFIEEPTPPQLEENFSDTHVLTKPKRITILLERNEFEERVSKISEPNEVVTAEAKFSEERISEEPKQKNNFFGKVLVITLASLIVVTAVVLYLYFKAGSPNQEVAQQTPAENQSQNINSAENPRNTISRESLGLNPDDFSEFPTSATPPVPVKEGGSVDVSKIVGKVENQNLPKNEEILSQAQKEELARKTQTAQINKPASGETRLTNMVFSDGKSYNFQISSWKNQTLAQTEVNRLRSLGFNAFLVEAYLPDKGGTWYRIRIGSFKSEQEALDFKKKNSF